MLANIAPRLLIAAALAFFAAGCALGRPHVKSLRDREAGHVELETVVATTVSSLNAVASHCGPTGDHRIHEEEFHVYQVVGRIARVKRERDRDVHIVLEDPDEPRDHLVVELDDPDFRGNARSLYRDRLAAARQMFVNLQRSPGSEEVQDLRGVLVRVTGVGFFDMNHLQVGRSRSCMELHPILAIERVLGSSGRTEPSSQARSARHGTPSQTPDPSARRTEGAGHTREVRSGAQSFCLLILAPGLSVSIGSGGKPRLRAELDLRSCHE